jgi:hypothetical protein
LSIDKSSIKDHTKLGAKVELPSDPDQAVLERKL